MTRKEIAKRLQKILDLLIVGERPATIAKLLNLDRKTVWATIERECKKQNCKSTYQLMYELGKSKSS